MSPHCAPRFAVPVVLLLLFAGPAAAGQWRFPLTINYSAGFRDVLDFHEDAAGVDADLTFPIGVGFQPYYEFAHGSRIGFGIGPMAFILFEDTGGDSFSYFDVPLHVTYGFVFLKDRGVTPTVRVGGVQHFASGDLVDSQSPGLLAAVGLEFARRNDVSFAFEIIRDDAEIDLEDGGFTQTVKPGETLVQFQIIFGGSPARREGPRQWRSGARSD